jgi:hypothetical protein
MQNEAVRHDTLENAANVVPAGLGVDWIVQGPGVTTLARSVCGAGTMAGSGAAVDRPEPGANR